MRFFMNVSQAVRDTLLFVICTAIALLTAAATWLVDEETIRLYKEKHND